MDSASFECAFQFGDPAIAETLSSLVFYELVQIAFAAVLSRDLEITLHDSLIAPSAKEVHFAINRRYCFNFAGLSASDSSTTERS